MNELSELYVSTQNTIREVMERIDRGAQGIALVVDEDERFVATITDGDIRRAILAGGQLDDPLAPVLGRRTVRPGGSITVTVGTPVEDQSRLMEEYDIRHLPVLDDDGRIVELATRHGAERAAQLPVQAVIMAGGFGTRLRPFTDHTPKPMLSIAGRPLMERTIESLQQAGVRRINITTHYMPEKISNYFGSGSRLGVELNYVSEEQPLGTAGALSLMDESDDPLLVMNGDILTRIDYRALYDFHQDQQAELTVGVRHYEVELPYGVIDAKRGRVRRLREKPKYEFLVNAGVYVLQPSARRLIPPGQHYHMTDLIEELLSQNRIVACFPIIEYWLDVGKQDDLRRAQRDVPLRWAA
jgi:dTDP-glucose pyrophosphorylase